jgi:dTDP-glucose 4,6-dehydratase
MKLLVTGGAGFIGSAFIREANKRGYDIALVDKLSYAGDLARLEKAKEKVRRYKTDICDFESLGQIYEKERPEAVVHFAAETHVDRSILFPQDFVLANVVGTANLLQLAHKYEVKKFIHISTDEVYGELPADKGLKFKETDSLLPNSPYSASKASADMFVRSFQKTFGLPAIIIRPSNNYGPWQYPEKLIPLAIARVLSGEKIPVYGKGENIRTWFFVEDCAGAILNVLEKGRVGEIYNIGSLEEKRNIELVEKLLSLLGKGKESIEFVPDRPGHDFRYAVDISKIKSHTGWTPRVFFDEGLERTVKWYLENKDWLFKKRAEAEEFVTELKKNFAQQKKK